MQIETEIKKRLAEMNAVRTGDHFVYTSGLHGHTYVDKNRIFLDPLLIDKICLQMASLCQGLQVEVVAGPEKGGIVLANRVAVHLQGMKLPQVIFLEKEDAPPTLRHRLHDLIEASWQHFNFPHRQQGLTTGLIITTLESLKNYIEKILDETNDPKAEDTFVLKRGYDKIVKGKKVLITEDVLTTGGSVAKSIQAIREAGGEVVGAVAICNRGGVTAEMLGIPFLTAFMNIDLPSWPEDECPMCKADKPINVEVGHGKKYLEQKTGGEITGDCMGGVRIG